MKEDKKPTFEFREQITPPRVCHLACQKKVSRLDLTILWLVNSLVRAQTSKAGLGCWASNKYIADALGAHAMSISEEIQKLESMGLLMVVYVGEQRYLECEWSRTAEERAALEGDYGVSLRKAYKKMEDLLKGGDKEKNLGAKEKTLAPHKEESLPECNKDSKDERGARPKRPRPPSPSRGFLEDTTPTTPQPEDVYSQTARLFKDQLIKHKRSPRKWSPLKWASELRLLHQKDNRENWLKLLTVFGNHCSAQDRTRYKLPLILNTEEFRKRIDWIEDALTKAGLLEEDMEDSSPIEEVSQPEGKFRFTIPTQESD